MLRGELATTRVSVPASLKQRPRPSLGFINPNFDQARRRDVPVLITHAVRLAQACCKSFTRSPVIVMQLSAPGVGVPAATRVREPSLFLPQSSHIVVEHGMSLALGSNSYRLGGDQSLDSDAGSAAPRRPRRAVH
jgi:hypothetical protein